MHFFGKITTRFTDKERNWCVTLRSRPVTPHGSIKSLKNGTKMDGIQLRRFTSNLHWRLRGCFHENGVRSEQE
ncbi:hypothetical protein Y032_0016g3003 [Ancylostoma ceylanicum]|uniref:Uncharacterized protein n=1 Tax=Ancylostoma ceylanicum TaxID=53326 RepID=A0A016V818_9BILA|nr:hypothetical protein Y032_0016g3003 [Ancylostoma ceylanicum]